MKDPYTLNAMDHKALTQLIRQNFAKPDEALFAEADRVRRMHYGNKVYIRGLIEVSNICRKDCYYCGIRKSNENVHRYRLTKEEILSCCENGYALGMRTFVMQGGEDGYFNQERMGDIISEVRNRYPDCAITLSLGELDNESYAAFSKAGANRFLLRHETANAEHYAKLHPPELTLARRIQCLWELKALGYQVGAGFMVGSPYQTPETLAEDLLLLKELQPHMVGIGPFIPQKDTPFANQPTGSLQETLVMLALTRILLPKALLPSTTALGTIHPQGREMGLQVGGNVVMPNLSPVENRKFYALYDNKAAFGAESAEGVRMLYEKIRAAGYEPDMGRGDHASMDQCAAEPSHPAPFGINAI